jgi:pimeloyl-ACP methyl ester carboxylesterase
MEGFVEVNGVRLQYLDWAGSGPALILIHGLGDNAHVFDDLAPAFTDHFHVIAYTRRGSGNSDVKGPYDLTTLTEDLHGLMDALGITRAALVGHSAGGEEITELAAQYPERVSRIIYLDAAYDYAMPEFRIAFKALPIPVRPASATSSLDEFRAYQKALWYPTLDDIRRIEADLREKVIVQPDGTLKDRVSPDVMNELWAALQTNKPQSYERVRCPALAIYPRHLYDLSVPDARTRAQMMAYEQRYWDPFRNNIIERLRREMKSAEIVRVSGSHSSFFLTDRQVVVDLMRRFLGQGTSQQLAGLTANRNVVQVE